MHLVPPFFLCSKLSKLQTPNSPHTPHPHTTSLSYKYLQPNQSPAQPKHKDSLRQHLFRCHPFPPMAESFEPPHKRWVPPFLLVDTTTDTADRISELPNALLTQILSLLTTKQSVVTGALSKRWRPIWTAVPVLDFDDEATGPADRTERDETKAHESTGFSEFVYSVLLLHEARPVTQFRLRCAQSSCSQRDIATWLCQAARRGVEEIDLYLSLSRYVALPRRLFNCESVTVMKLDGVFLNALVGFSVCLPSLKVLRIGDRVLFGCHDYVVKLLAGCPVLEDLVLESTYNDACGGPGCAKGKFELNLSRLLKAKIGFSWYVSCQKSMLVFFKALSNVRCLSLLPSTVECLKLATASDIPAFNNLVQLEISFGNYSWDLLINFLQHCHKLEVLIINKESQKHAAGQEPGWNHPLSVPECLYSNLKTFCLREFQGLEGEMEFVGFLMHNAKVLETMTIYIASFLDLVAKHQIRSSLLELQTNFQSCKITFYGA